MGDAMDARPPKRGMPHRPSHGTPGKDGFGSDLERSFPMVPEQFNLTCARVPLLFIMSI